MNMTSESIVQKVELSNGETVLSWDRAGSPMARYAYAAFCLIFLVLYLFLVFFVRRSGSSTLIPGILIGFTLYIATGLLRTQVRESVTVRNDLFDYDSGTTNILNFNKSYRDRPKLYGFESWGKLLEKRKVLRGLSKEKVLLRYDEHPKTISFEYNLKRVEIGSCLSENDLEYVWQHLQS